MILCDYRVRFDDGKMMRVIALGLLLLLLHLVSSAQTSSFPFTQIQNLTTRDGLSTNDCYQIFQDSRGYIWIWTFYGLNRFEGNSFKVYGDEYEDSSTLANDQCAAPMIERGDNIWIGTFNNGLFAFNTKTEKVTGFRHQPGNSNSPADDIVNSLAMDKKGMLWIATAGGLNSFDPDKNKFVILPHRDDDHTTIASDNVAGVCLGDSNHLWVLTAGGLDELNTETRKVIFHLEFPPAKLIAKQLGATQMTEDKSGNLWVASYDSGLYCFNTYSRKMLHYTHDDKHPFSLSDNELNGAVMEDRQGNVWMATGENGIDFLDSKTRKFYHSSLQPPFSDANVSVTSICEDSSGKIWITSDHGIFTIDPPYKKFHFIQHNQFDKNSLSSNWASGFLQLNDSIVLLTSWSGVVSYNINTGVTAPFEIMEHGKNIFKQAQVAWNTYCDRQQTVWFCCANGLISYNTKTKSHRWYQNNPADSTSLSAASCTGIVEDRKGRYWVTTWGGGFDAFDPATGKFRAFKVHAGDNSISSNDVGIPFEDSRGIIYIGCWTGGLITFNPDEETFKIYRYHRDSATGANFGMAYDVEDKEGYIWMGSYGGGLIVFNPSNEKLRSFTTKDGLPSNMVGGIAIDDDGNVWVGSSKGISSFKFPKDPFDPDVKIEFRNYDVSDGIPSNQVNIGSVYRDSHGRIYCGTYDAGFFYFNSKELANNPFIPPVRITDFKLFNHSVNTNDSTHLLSQLIGNTKEIVLNHSQNVISFTFAALNYIHPEKNQYAYMLEPFDKNWIHTDASYRTAYYTNLDPGDYTFKVKGSNNDGVWNETPATLHLIITPPYWQTWWFRILVGFAFVLVLYGAYRYRLYQILKLQSIRNKIAADLHDEIGSTLNSISIYSEVVKQELGKPSQALDMIGTSSRKVIDSMSDIIWTINPKNDTFENIILRLRSFSYNLLKAKNIEHSFRADDHLNGIKLSMEDRRNFYLIFKEAINNLVKYSQATRAAILLSYDPQFVQMIIHDNGLGFDATKEYNGNGITNMKRRAAEMKAKFSIDSKPGEGTTVELRLKT